MTPRKTSEWEGYSLEQLRHRRELNMARIELIHHKLHELAEPYSTPVRAANSIFGQVVDAMSYVDYIVLGFRAMRYLRRWFKK